MADRRRKLPHLVVHLGNASLADLHLCVYSCVCLQLSVSLCLWFCSGDDLGRINGETKRWRSPQWPPGRKGLELEDPGKFQKIIRLASGSALITLRGICGYMGSWVHVGAKGMKKLPDRLFKLLTAPARVTHQLSERPAPPLLQRTRIRGES